MKVFKFGGASINSPDRFKSTAEIITGLRENTLVIISAMGKTTNALEAVVNAFIEGRQADAIKLFAQVKNNHLQMVKYLLVLNALAAEKRLTDFFTEVEWLLYDRPVQGYDYYYDQIVCTGELLSTCIMHYYLQELGVQNQWLDVRDVLRTDNNFRAAGVDWQRTTENVEEKLKPLFEQQPLVITQGFIGSTSDNESTTLGREGSDYSAAIFAHILDAGSVTIWKDVEAVMNADPHQFANAVKIPQLSYTEVIEMAYYGAQVIHPKTVKPLQNKKIPLLVKSFLQPDEPGTTISSEKDKAWPPIIVVKANQVLMHLRTLDFGFVEGAPVEFIHRVFDEVKHSPNIRQNTAVSLYYSFDDRPEKIDQIAAEAASVFDVEIERNLTLITIRHYTGEVINELAANKVIVLQQKTSDTIQMLCRG